MKIFGREVIGYRMKEAPDVICIDVMQKEGDCIMGLTEHKRLNCPNDCGNSFVVVYYHDVNKEIVDEAALMKGTSAFYHKEFVKLGLECTDIRVIMENIGKNLKDYSMVDSETIIGKDILYKGTLIGRLYTCDLVSGMQLREGPAEIQKNLQYIRDNIEEIIVKTEARKNVKGLSEISRKGRLESC